MPAQSFDHLIIPALSALCASGGALTLADLSSHLETRHGPTDHTEAGEGSSDSQAFRATVQSLLTGPGSLTERGFVTGDPQTGVIQVTPKGREFVGR